MTNVNEQPKTQKSANKKSNGAKLLWVGALLIVAATAAVIFLATRKISQASTNVGFFTVRRDNLTVTVSQSGSIRAHKSQQYKCQVQSRGSSSGITILSIVPSGTVITQEDVNEMVLIRLDSSSLVDRLVTERMNLATNSDTVTSAKETYDIQVLDNESSLADAELRVRFALLDLQKYLGDAPAKKLVKDINDTSNVTKYVTPFIEEMEKDPNLLVGSSAWQQWKRLQDDITLAQGNLKTQQLTLAGTERLYDANFVSVLDLDRDRLTLKNRVFSLESSQLSLDLFLAYDFPKNAEQYLSNYIEAKRSYQRALAQCRSRLAQANSRLNTAKTRYDEQEANVKDLEQQVAYCTIKAKAPGLVIYGTGGSEDQMRAMMGGGRGGGSSRIIDVGETVSEGQVLISIPDTSAWIAEVSIHETEVDKVRPGQPAVVVMEVAPDKTLQGEVLSVASLPDQQRGMLNPDIKVYKTLVRIDGTENASFLKSQMSCRVEILVGKAEDALIVPITSVANRGGKKVCYAINAQGSSEEHEVTAGLFNDKYVEILEGLEEGDKVLLNPPLITEMSTKTTDMFEGVDALPQENTNGRGQTRGGAGNRGGFSGQRGTMRGQGMGGFNGNSDQIPPMQMDESGGQTRSMRGSGMGTGARGAGMGGTRDSGGSGGDAAASDAAPASVFRQKDAGGND